MFTTSAQQRKLCGVLFYFPSVHETYNHFFFHALFLCKWPLTTIWLTYELNQSVPTYKHTSIDRPAGCCSGTIVIVETKHVAVLFLKMTGKCFGSVQMELWVQTHMVSFTCSGGVSCLSSDERSGEGGGEGSSICVVPMPCAVCLECCWWYSSTHVRDNARWYNTLCSTLLYSTYDTKQNGVDHKVQ